MSWDEYGGGAEMNINDTLKKSNDDIGTWIEMTHIDSD